MQSLNVVGSKESKLKSLMQKSVPVGVCTLLLSLMAYNETKYGTKESLASISRDLDIERADRNNDKKEFNDKLDLILRILYQIKEK